MTDEEILKAFECCCGDDTNGTHCKDCPAEKYNFDWCSDEVLRQMVDYTKRLQAENAALRSRLEKAVELPCKIGDEVYEVHGKCDRKNCVYNGYYGQWRCDYGGKTNCNPFITVNKFRYCDIPMVGKTIFVTKEAAEARLKELKGENQSAEEGKSETET